LPFSGGVTAKNPGLVANEKQKAQQIHGEQKKLQALDRHDDIGRYADTFNHIGQISKQYRRPCNKAEQEDTYNFMQGESSNQCKSD
jgi:hypothetical protein